MGTYFRELSEAETEIPVYIRFRHSAWRVEASSAMLTHLR
jgi:hypothetical protein